MPIRSPRFHVGPVADGPRASAVVALPQGASSDAELLSGIIAARPAAVAELFDRHSPRVRQVLARTVGNTSDVDDLVQETFLTVVRRAPTLRDPTALGSFVVSVAIRIARNELRRRALRRFIGFDDEACYGPAQEDVLAREGVRRLEVALNRLDADARILFVLRHVEQLELTELAQTAGVSLATVKRKLARAERRFEAIAASDPALRDYLERTP